jgi:hypothetical protein
LSTIDIASVTELEPKRFKEESSGPTPPAEPGHINDKPDGQESTDKGEQMSLF